MPTETSQNHSKPLQPIQLKAIDMLSTGAKQVVVVERLDVASATLHRWLQQAHFIAALDRRINDGREEALRQLRTLNSKAVETLRRLLDDEDTPAGVKMTTAFKILEIATPAYVADTDRSETIGEDSLKRIREQIYGIFPADHDDDEPANRTERVHHGE